MIVSWIFNKITHITKPYQLESLCMNWWTKCGHDKKKEGTN